MTTPGDNSRTPPLIQDRKIRATKITIDIELEDGGFIRHIYLDTWAPITTTIRKVVPPLKGEQGRVEITIPRWPVAEQSHPGRESNTEDVSVNPDIL